MRLYVIAMEDEARDLLPLFNKIQDVPFALYQNKDALLAITKVGKVNASFVLSTVAAKYKLSKIINLGFAGANGSFNVGDIYTVNEARYHDFDATMFGYEMGQVPKFPASYSSDFEFASKTPYPQTKLFTGDYFMTELRDDQYLVDMEGTALFQVAYLLNIPIVSIKVISDVIGKENHLGDYETFEKIGSAKILEIYMQIEKF